GRPRPKTLVEPAGSRPSLPGVHLTFRADRARGAQFDKSFSSRLIRLAPALPLQEDAAGGAAGGCDAKSNSNCVWRRCPRGGAGVLRSLFRAGAGQLLREISGAARLDLGRRRRSGLSLRIRTEWPGTPPSRQAVSIFEAAFFGSLQTLEVARQGLDDAVRDRAVTVAIRVEAVGGEAVRAALKEVENRDRGDVRKRERGLADQVAPGEDERRADADVPAVSRERLIESEHADRRGRVRGPELRKDRAQIRGEPGAGRRDRGQRLGRSARAAERVRQVVAPDRKQDQAG